MCSSIRIWRSFWSVVIGGLWVNTWQLSLAYAVTSRLDPWMVDSGAIDPQHFYGEVVANGMIGMICSPAPFRTEQTLIYGAYEPYWPGGVSGLVRTFDVMNLKMAVNGRWVEKVAALNNYHQTVDFKRAEVSAEFEFNGSASVRYAVRALRQFPALAMMEVTVIAKKDLDLRVTSDIPEPSAKATVDAFDHPPIFSWLTHIERFHNLPDLDLEPDALKMAAATAKGPSGVTSIAATQAFLFDEKSGPNVLYAGNGLEFVHHLRAGEVYHFALIGAVITSAQVSDPLNETRRLTNTAAHVGIADLIGRHVEDWSELWKSDIEIAGDPESQRDVHSMLYHLYSFVREGSGYSIPPMGLSGGSADYLGHIFWDAESWMYPPLLALHPELARSLLDYRFNRLDAARRNAMLNGYRGAEFPWESAASGEEDLWGEYLPRELHVTAVVALAAWDYYRVSQDRDWLRTRGFPLIKEAADFWTSAVSRKTVGRYDVTHVVAADEYAVDVDNDAFTNGAVRANLTAATAAARVLGVEPNPQWDRVRQGIPLLKFSSGVTREHATYQGEKIKQADVNLLAYPLREITDPNQIRRDLEYYSSRVDDTGGPAMTKSIFATLYERLGEPNKALALLKAGYQPNRRPPFGMLTESVVSDNPYFATGAGGILQALIFGFAGLEITDTGLSQVPRSLPAQWKSIKLLGIGPKIATSP